jgi:hypothetical protein
MAVGPGRYDDLCTEAREKAKALGVILIVIDGEHGMGFSCQATPEVMITLPDMLRHMADTITEDIKNDLLG